MLEYHAAYYPIEDGYYFVKLLDFPGVITQGKNLDNARYMIRDALKLMAEHFLEGGRSLPPPNPRARDKKAELIEPVYLSVRVTPGNGNEKKKVPQTPSRS